MAAAGRLAVGCGIAWRKSVILPSSANGFGFLGARTGLNARVFVPRQQRGFQVPSAAKKLFTELKKIREEADAGPVEFEPNLSIVLYPDPKLRAKNIRINSFDENLKRLVDEMLEVMYKTDGVGLSAPQVGVNARLMVFNPEGERGKGKEYVFVNPVIVKFGKERDVDREGCLSFYSAQADVERPMSIRVEAQDMNGKKFGTTFRGWIARIFQHEYDHLEGVLYIDRMSPKALNSIGQDLSNLEEEYEKRTGNLRPESVKDKLLSTVES